MQDGQLKPEITQLEKRNEKQKSVSGCGRVRVCVLVSSPSIAPIVERGYCTTERKEAESKAERTIQRA